MMKHTNTNISRAQPSLLFFAAALTLLCSLIFSVLPVKAATNASMSLTPGSGSYTTGSTVTVTVVVNSGGSNVNAVQANFSYPSSLLQFKSFDYGTSAFGLQAESSASSGNVRIARGNITPVSGSSLVVGKVVFTALNAGTAGLSIVSGSNVVSSDSNADILGTKNGASYTLSVPATPPPPTSTGTTTPTTTKTTTTKTTAPTSAPTSTPASSTGDAPSEVVPTDSPEDVVAQSNASASAESDNGGVTSQDPNEGFDWQLVSYISAGLITLIMLGVAGWWLLGRRSIPHHATYVPPKAMDNPAPTHLDAGERLVTPGQNAPTPEHQPLPPQDSPVDTQPTSNEPQVVTPEKPADKSN